MYADTSLYGWELGLWLVLRIGLHRYANALACDAVLTCTVKRMPVVMLIHILFAPGSIHSPEQIGQ